MNTIKKIAIALALSSACVAPVMAQDFGSYGGYGYSSGFDWDGFYSGVYGGGVVTNDTAWDAGIFTGVNMSIESIVIGAEAQLGGTFGDAWGLDALVLAKGGLNMGNILVYGTGGVGVVRGDWGYAMGAGAEYGITDYMSARVEGLGTGKFGEGFSDLRLSAGLAFHM